MRLFLGSCPRTGEGGKEHEFDKCVELGCNSRIHPLLSLPADINSDSMKKANQPSGCQHAQDWIRFCQKDKRGAAGGRVGSVLWPRLECDP